MADPKISASLQATVFSAPTPAEDVTNPYFSAVSQADARLQQYELETTHDPAKQPWGAPTPSKEDIERSQSAPLLQSAAAVAARKEASDEKGSKAGGGASGVKLTIRPSSASIGKSTDAAASRGAARPSTSAGARKAHVGKLPAAPGSNVEAAPGETFTNTQIRKLEAEVEHLRETIDVLLQSQGGKHGRPLGSASPLGSRPSGLRSSGATLTSPSKMRGPEARAASGYAVHEQNRSLLSTTLADKKEHEGRLLALQKEVSRLSDSAVHEEVSRSNYRRMDITAGMRATTPTSRPVQLPKPLTPSPSPAEGRRASMAGRRSSVGQAASPAGTRRASMAGQGDRRTSVSAGTGIAEGRRSSVSHTQQGVESKVDAEHAAVRARRFASLKEERDAGVATESAVLAAASPHSAVSKSKTAGRGKRGHAESKEGKEEDTAAATASSTSASGSASSRPHTAPATRPHSSSSSAKLEDTYAAPPGVHKTVKDATSAAAFTLSGSKSDGITERKFAAYMAEKAAEEDAALNFKFKAMPIAAATRDLHAYRRIMEKLARKREEAHAKRAAQLSSTMKPFEVVTAHCDEHAARLAACRARFLLNEQRELQEGRKFHANPVPNLTNPDGMFAELVKREAERPNRVAAMAREFYAAAALPPRMTLAAENERRRLSEREARLRKEEELDRAQNKFTPVPLPNFDVLHTTFEDSLVSAKVSAVTAMGGLTVPHTFGFDKPERLEGDLKRKEKWIREHDLATSTSMALRRRSMAFAEGNALTPGVNPNAPGAEKRPASASARSRSGSMSISAALAVSSAPPATMTRSVQLKALAVQQKLRAQQEAQLAAVEEDEAYYSFIKESTRTFAPVFQAIEKARVPGLLAWQMDKVAASASEAAQAFNRTSLTRQQENKTRILAAQQNRPLVMMQYTMQQKSEVAKAEALRTVASVASTGRLGSARRPASATVRSTVDRGLAGTQLFTADEQELMGYPASASD